jgi:hypothetical protein
MIEQIDAGNDTALGMDDLSRFYTKGATKWQAN